MLETIRPLSQVGVNAGLSPEEWPTVCLPCETLDAKAVIRRSRWCISHSFDATVGFVGSIRGVLSILVFLQRCIAVPAF